MRCGPVFKGDETLLVRLIRRTTAVFYVWGGKERFANVYECVCVCWGLYGNGINANAEIMLVIYMFNYWWKAFHYI